MPTGRQRSRAWAVVGAGCVLALTVLAVLVSLRWHPLTDLDAHADRSANNLVSSHHWLERISRDVTQIGDPRVINLLTVAGALAAATRRRWDLVALVVGVRVLEFAVNGLTKHFVSRPRPHLLDPITHAGGFSFPSGHAAGTAAVFAALAILFLRPGARWGNRAVVIAVAVVIGCVAATRVLLGVHYPSDVAAGILVGVGALAAVRSVLPAR